MLSPIHANKCCDLFQRSKAGELFNLLDDFRMITLDDPIMPQRIVDLKRALAESIGSTLHDSRGHVTDIVVEVQ